MAFEQNTSEFDVEKLMEMIQRRVDTRPDAKEILARVEDTRRYANGVCQATSFSEGVNGRVKSFIYKCLMRVFRGNFEQQRLFNHAVVDTLQVIAEDMYKLQQRIPGKNDNKAPEQDL